VTALILLHGALGAAAQFAALREALRERAGRPLAIYTLDFEGHGDEPHRDRPYRMAHFMENVCDLMDQNAIDRASLFGYSMGGYVALCLAAARPDRAERVMTLGTKFRWTPEGAAREGAMLDPRRLEEKVPQFGALLRARHVGAGWEDVLDRTREMLAALGAVPELTEKTLGSIAIPVRIAVGDRDGTVSVDESAEIARFLPRGELEVLLNTPHPLEKVDAARLADSIVQFLATP
jgi:pimeloyl-ACP methyl ester carboxylesterase